MDRNALDWLFSTAPQTIAAFVGLIFAGVSFIIGKIDEKIKEDPTLKEIYEAIRNQMYSGLKLLLFTTSSSIVLDLICLSINPLLNNEKILSKDLFYFDIFFIPALFLLNVFVLFQASSYIKKIMDPKFFEKTVKQLLKQYQEKGSSHKTVSIGTFMENYIRLEKILKNMYRNHTNKCDEDNGNMNINQRLMTARDYARKLYGLKLLKKNDFNEVMDLNRFRNLVAHGEIDQIEKEMNDRVKIIIEKLENNQEGI